MFHNDKFKKLKKRVEYLKEDEKEVHEMAGVMETYAKEYANECVLKQKVEIADNIMGNYNFSLDDACKMAQITVEQYKAAKEKEYND